ncbi:phosphate transporter PHO1-like [Salvia hispanica]|uniref:phosphate transporter PHO1-like n=1 Tax=Salvia hispanica TaxID=49212 RepID=UPI00200952F7|nr:phosphate transporter PHO1-like [Salvia hispanica]
MVKFSKELEAQLIPEWKDAFVNYWQLKKHVKKIKLSRKPKHLPNTATNYDFGCSIFDPVRALARKLAGDTAHGEAREIIQVKSRVATGDGEEEDEVYETELDQLFSEEHEVKVFFEMLDEELNKVNHFYKSKETEFLERGGILNKQLQILLDLKRLVADRRRKNFGGQNGGGSGLLSRSGSSLGRNSDSSGLNRVNQYSVACSSLNMVAFTKILKKFDKVTNQQASASYLKVVKRSHFISSDKVVRNMDEVESLFTQHFANSDRKKAMKFLRPQQQKDSHMVTFFVGLFTGTFVTLFSVYAILVHLSGMYSAGTEATYIETVYPIFSMFALVSLHLFMYGCNLLMWKKTRINYNFIFEFLPSTALKYRDAFLICTSLMTAVVGAMVVHLILLAAGFSPQQVDIIPGILLLSCVLLLICPLNIFYRPTRFCFIRVIRNIVCSPFYKVLMVDFFMADQLTSQIPLLRHMESAACYFLAGSFKTHRYETCKSGKMYRELAYVISFAPYYWRAMQCARRWFDENNVEQLANLGKYVSAMVAAGARLTYARQPTQAWMLVVLVTSVVATLYQLYWDFVKDWGLLNAKSKNPWLRDDLLLKNRSIYYASIGLNCVLRVAWVEAVMKYNPGVLESRLIAFLLASLEVIRRGHWNYYRLENEHLNNVGKYRAVKTVPLPFSGMDSDG